MDRFQNEIARAKQQPVDEAAYATTFDGKIAEGGIILWDGNIAWENKVHAKVILTEAGNGTLVNIEYRKREGVWFGILIAAAVLIILLYMNQDLIFFISVVCFTAGAVYDWFKLTARREPLENYVQKIIA